MMMKVLIPVAVLTIIVTYFGLQESKLVVETIPLEIINTSGKSKIELDEIVNRGPGNETGYIDNPTQIDTGTVADQSMDGYVDSDTPVDYQYEMDSDQLIDGSSDSDSPLRYDLPEEPYEPSDDNVSINDPQV